LLSLDIHDKFISLEFFDVHDFFVVSKNLVQLALNFLQLIHNLVSVLPFLIFVSTVDFLFNNLYDVFNVKSLKLYNGMYFDNFARSISGIFHSFVRVWLSRLKLMDKDRTIFTCAVDKLAES
jgi:hypothetical protein